MSTTSKIVLAVAAAALTVTGLFVALVLAVMPAKVTTTGLKGAHTQTMQKVADIEVKGLHSQPQVVTLDPPATAAETEAFYATLLPKIGQKVGSATVTSVTNRGLGCYQYTLSGSKEQATGSCIDVALPALNAWVLNYRATT